MLGSEAGPCLPKLCLPGALSEGCRTRLLSGHNISASAGLGKIEQLQDWTFSKHFQYYNYRYEYYITTGLS